jgi:hypothetical protein
MPRYEYPSLRQGLVGCWVPSLGASGLSLIDRSGRGNHAALTNMAGQDNWRASGSGVALNFDGANDFVLGTSSNGFPVGSAARSLSVWFKMSANSNAEFISYGGNTFSGCRFALYRDTTTGVGVEISGSGAASAWTYDNLWHHLATTYDASATNATACSVFLDGVRMSVTTSASGVTINTVKTPVTIGAISGATSSYNLNGQIDDARIYSRALTAPEIRLLASRRGIGLQAQPTRHASLPRKISLNVANTWKDCDCYINDPSGVPKLTTPSQNVFGVWK